MNGNGAGKGGTYPSQLEFLLPASHLMLAVENAIFFSSYFSWLVVVYGSGHSFAP